MSENRKARKEKHHSRHMTVRGWLGTLLLSAIPVVNLIFWIIWAFASKKHSRKTFAIACLILTLVFAAIIAGVVSLYGEKILEWARQIDPQLFSKAMGLVE